MFEVALVGERARQFAEAFLLEQQLKLAAAGRYVARRSSAASAARWRCRPVSSAVFWVASVSKPLLRGERGIGLAQLARGGGGGDVGIA